MVCDKGTAGGTAKPVRCPFFPIVLFTSCSITTKPSCIFIQDQHCIIPSSLQCITSSTKKTCRVNDIEDRAVPFKRNASYIHQSSGATLHQLRPFTAQFLIGVVNNLVYRRKYAKPGGQTRHDWNSEVFMPASCPIPTFCQACWPVVGVRLIDL